VLENFEDRTTVAPSLPVCARGSVLSTIWSKKALVSKATQISELNTSVSLSILLRLPKVLEMVILWVTGRSGRWAVYCCLSEFQRITNFVLLLSSGTTFVGVVECPVCDTRCSSSRGTLKDDRRPSPRWRFPYRSYRYLIWHLIKIDKRFNQASWHPGIQGDNLTLEEQDPEYTEPFGA
jgi:hypothetical protein